MCEVRSACDFSEIMDRSFGARSSAANEAQYLVAGVFQYLATAAKRDLRCRSQRQCRDGAEEDMDRHNLALERSVISPSSCEVLSLSESGEPNMSFCSRASMACKRARAVSSCAMVTAQRSFSTMCPSHAVVIGAWPRRVEITELTSSNSCSILACFSKRTFFCCCRSASKFVWSNMCCSPPPLMARASSSCRAASRRHALIVSTCDKFFSLSSLIRTMSPSNCLHSDSSPESARSGSALRADKYASMVASNSSSKAQLGSEARKASLAERRGAAGACGGAGVRALCSCEDAVDLCP
mmetsp:Transcript_17546/g.51352  ORF Transcript_17546/g.51352 Transcript_17546/m.51352 type:complete len:297 (+) Transcript_17546:2216-3106(+)